MLVATPGRAGAERAVEARAKAEEAEEAEEDEGEEEEEEEAKVSGGETKGEQSSSSLLRRRS